MNAGTVSSCTLYLCANVTLPFETSPEFSGKHQKHVYYLNDLYEYQDSGLANLIVVLYFSEHSYSDMGLS